MVRPKALRGWRTYVLAVAFLVAASAIWLAYAWTTGEEAGRAVGTSFCRHSWMWRKGHPLDQALRVYCHAVIRRDTFPDVTWRDKAYNRGWDDGFNQVVNQLLR